MPMFGGPSQTVRSASSASSASSSSQSSASFFIGVARSTSLPPTCSSATSKRRPERRHARACASASATRAPERLTLTMSAAGKSSARSPAIDSSGRLAPMPTPVLSPSTRTRKALFGEPALERLPDAPPARAPGRRRGAARRGAAAPRRAETPERAWRRGAASESESTGAGAVSHGIGPTLLVQHGACRADALRGRARSCCAGTGRASPCAGAPSADHRRRADAEALVQEDPRLRRLPLRSRPS